MLHIILFIIKTIGIILISILGILVFLLLIVLVVPIRYQVEARKYEDIQGYVKVRWILSILYFRLKYEKEKFKYQIRIFGFIIKDSEKPKIIKIKKKKLGKVKKQKKKHNKDISRKKNNLKVIKKSSVEQNESKALRTNERLGMKDDEAKAKIDTENHIQDKSIQSIGKNHIEDNQKTPCLEDKKITLWEKLRNKIHIFFQKIKGIIDKIRNFFKKLKIKFIELNLTRETLVRRFNLVKTFFTEDVNKKGIKKIWFSIKKVSRHIYPKKIKAKVHFGTGDPSSTGQVLGIISMTYHLYQKSVQIVPDFNQEILEGNLYAKGRIRLFTLLIICIKLLVDKNFKQLLTSFKELKEEL